MSVPAENSAGAAAIRPLTIPVTPEAEIEALRARIAATRWPEKEPVADLSQGVQLATVQALARYWETEYDFRRLEARLNAFPQFMTEIDGLDIHFIHLRSPQENALPLIITHGWPGSVVEMLNVAARWHTAAAQATRSTWSSRRCRATGSPPSRTRLVGTSPVSHAPGPS